MEVLVHAAAQAAALGVLTVRWSTIAHELIYICHLRSHSCCHDVGLGQTECTVELVNATLPCRTNGKHTRQSCQQKLPKQISDVHHFIPSDVADAKDSMLSLVSFLSVLGW